MSPFAFAVQQDNAKIIEYLVDECGINDDGYVDEWRMGNGDGRMIGHIATYFGRKDILSFLDEKCSLDLKDDQNQDGMTPLHCACSYGHEEVAKYLIQQKGCDPTRSNQVCYNTKL